MARPRRFPLTLVGLVAALAVLAGLVGYLVVDRGTGCLLAPSGSCVRVLFIGNSYTSTNDLPGVFARLAASGGHPVEVGMIAPGGAYLADHAADAAVDAAIASGSWTVVVLQEQSQVPAMPSARDSSMAPAVSSLVRRVLAAGARPYLLETWAHRDGLASGGLDYAGMQAAIDAAYRSIGRQVGADVVPAGEAWQRALAGDASLAADPSPGLWQGDGSHPSLAGTYLAACAVYASVLGSSPVGLGATAGLPAPVAAELQGFASGP